MDNYNNYKNYYFTNTSPDIIKISGTIFNDHHVLYIFFACIKFV